MEDSDDEDFLMTGEERRLKRLRQQSVSSSSSSSSHPPPPALHIHGMHYDALHNKYYKIPVGANAAAMLFTSLPHLQSKRTTSLPPKAVHPLPYSSSPSILDLYAPAYAGCQTFHLSTALECRCMSPRLIPDYSYSASLLHSTSYQLSYSWMDPLLPTADHFLFYDHERRVLHMCGNKLLDEVTRAVSRTPSSPQSGGSFHSVYQLYSVTPDRDAAAQRSSFQNTLNIRHFAALLYETPSRITSVTHIPSTTFTSPVLQASQQNIRRDHLINTRSSMMIWDTDDFTKPIEEEVLVGRSTLGSSTRPGNFELLYAFPEMPNPAMQSMYMHSIERGSMFDAAVHPNFGKGEDVAVLACSNAAHLLHPPSHHTTKLKLSHHKSDILSCAWLQDNVVLCGAREGGVAVWDVRGNTPVLLCTPRCSSSVTWLQSLPSLASSIFLSAAMDGQLACWDIRAAGGDRGIAGDTRGDRTPSGMLHRYQGHHNVHALVRCSVSRDAKLLFAPGQDGFIRGWEVESGRMMGRWKPNVLQGVHNPAVHTVCYLDEYRSLIVGTDVGVHVMSVYHDRDNEEGAVIE